MCDQLLALSCQKQLVNLLVSILHFHPRNHDFVGIHVYIDAHNTWVYIAISFQMLCVIKFEAATDVYCNGFQELVIIIL